MQLGAWHLWRGNPLVLMGLLGYLYIARALHALDLRASALTVLRDFNDHATKFLNRLVARVGLEPTTSAL
jgi:hypothetical protein